MAKRILGIVGSYRKNGIIDCLVTETLSSAEALGATSKKIYLSDAHIEFCKNCRQCTQEPGVAPGKCIHSDDLNTILGEWKECDGLVIGLIAETMGAKPVKTIFAGLSAQEEHAAPSEKAIRQARAAGRQLAEGQ